MLLRLHETRKEYSALVGNARRSLGGRIVTYILSLPFNKLGFLGNLLQRYFDNFISNELIEGAKNFMRQAHIKREEIEKIQKQVYASFLKLEKENKTLKELEDKLNECTANETYY